MKICAVVPAYKVREHITTVVRNLAPYVDHTLVIDDCCPENSADHLLEEIQDAFAVTIIRLNENQGVGGAVVAGYLEAAQLGYEIAVKVDGDDQMNPSHIPSLIAPIEAGEADYTKGNRFFSPSYLSEMPRTRLIGNAALSFISKLSTGQWHIMDPTNGFTAIHTSVLPWLQLDYVQRRYFFETDMLFRLGAIGAVVQDIPMPSRYGNETSNLNVGKSLIEFLLKHIRLFGKRILFSYFLRNFNMSSIFLLASIPLLLFGIFFGASAWIESVRSGIPATAGTIMVAALPTIVGFQLLLGFLSFDMSTRTHRALWKKLGGNH